MATTILNNPYADFSGKLETFSTVADNKTIAASSYLGLTITTKKTGYRSIGVVGIYLANASSSGTGSLLVVPARFYVNSEGDTYVMIKNLNTSAAKIKITVYVLYEKI